MVKPEALAPRPAFLLSILGGLVATLLATALLFAAPALGLAFVEVPHLLGGIFTGHPETAFWLGFWIYFLIGVLAFGPVLALLWTHLPGHPANFLGALVKGLVWGLILFVATGILLPLLGAVHLLPAEVARQPGFFALEYGVLGAVTLLITHLAYGIALGLVTAMGQGISPIQLIGWRGHSKGEIRHVPLRMAERPGWMRSNGGRASTARGT